MPNTVASNQLRNPHEGGIVTNEACQRRPIAFVLLLGSAPGAPRRLGLMGVSLKERIELVLFVAVFAGGALFSRCRFCSSSLVNAFCSLRYSTIRQPSTTTRLVGCLERRFHAEESLAVACRFVCPLTPPTVPRIKGTTECEYKPRKRVFEIEP